MRQHASLPLTLIAGVVLVWGGVGCGSAPPPRTGFLSDYSSLRTIDRNEMRFERADLGDYDRFIVEPVADLLGQDTDLSPEQRAEAVSYFEDAFEEMLRRNGYTLTEDGPAGTARVRIALTDIQKSTWWLSLHPGTKLTGAGAGGASMEGEILDAATGDQLWAAVRSGRGNQFELDTFDPLDDVRDVIERWVEQIEHRLLMLREAERAAG